MKEITLYMTNDGRIFDNRFDCRQYEIEEILKNTGVQIYDKNGNVFPTETYIDDDTYNNCFKIVVKTKNDLRDIRTIYDYTGFYNAITLTGTWVWNEEEQTFRRKVFG